MPNNQFDADMKLDTGAEGVHAHGAQGVHAQGAQGVHPQGAQVKWQDDCGANRRLTLPQKRVLEQLAIWLKGEEKTIARIYWRIGEALGMSQRAARVHVEALKKKGLISSKIAYRTNSGQRIGARISIAPDAPIKHLPHKFSEIEIQEMKERERKEAQFRTLIRQGYSYVKELGGFVREPQNLRR